MAQRMNPFRPTRWEHHQVGDALIWFTKAAEDLAQPKSFYVYGSRGSGKTSLLRSICWEDLAFNRSLQMQRSLADFSHLGIYIRFPDHVSASLDMAHWNRSLATDEQSQLDYHRFFSLAIELACIEQAFEAAHALRLRGLVSYDADQELEAVQSITDEFPRLSEISGGSPRTFVELARACRRLIRLMNEACSRGSAGELVRILPLREPNQFLRFATEKLAAIVRIISNTSEKRVCFKFCLDDCEVLSDVQKRSLNTLVRLSKFPVFWIVSSVDTVRIDSKTFISAQPLTDADRTVISLNDREEVAFKELCQAVVSLRLLSASQPSQQNAMKGRDATRFFDLDERLGSETVNSVIGTMVRRSTKPEAEKILAGAELLKKLRAGRPGRGRKGAASVEPELPFYEAYILMHWRGREDAFVVDFADASLSRIEEHVGLFAESRFNAWLRRKQSAALYHVAARLKVRNVPLAGSNMIIGLADQSIRDFLEIMAEIYDEYVKKQVGESEALDALSKFSRSGSKIGKDVQSRAIQTASAKYVSGVGYGEEGEFDAIARLIRGLGNFVSILQTDVSDPRTLRTTERGIFHLTYSNSDADPIESNTVRNAIQQAELAGYIRIEKVPHHWKAKYPSSEEDSQSFRLHRRFAPYFNFSYRGPYEIVRLTPESLANLIFAKTDETPFQWASALAAGWNHDSEQYDLPLKPTVK